MSRPATADLKQRLLTAARELLVAQGYEGFSVRQVARAASVSPTAVYLHFVNKDALLHALIDEGMCGLHAAMSKASGDVVDPVERIKALCESYIDFGLANGELYEVMFNLAPTRMQRYPVEMYRRAYRNQQLFHEALAEVWDCEDVGAPELRHVVTSIWATLHGTVCLVANQRVDFALEKTEVIRRSVALATSLAREPRGC